MHICSIPLIGCLFLLSGNCPLLVCLTCTCRCTFNCSSHLYLYIYAVYMPSFSFQVHQIWSCLCNLNNFHSHLSGTLHMSYNVYVVLNQLEVKVIYIHGFLLSIHTTTLYSQLMLHYSSLLSVYWGKENICKISAVLWVSYAVQYNLRYIFIVLYFFPKCFSCVLTRLALQNKIIHIIRMCLTIKIELKLTWMAYFSSFVLDFHKFS